MPKITKRWLDALATPERDTVYWDEQLRGFGVRVTPSGARSFIVQYRNAQGRSRRLTVGPYGRYTPSQAREVAQELLRNAAAARKGLATDPAERQLQERSAITFTDLCDGYMEKCKSGLILGRQGRPKKPSTVAIDQYRIQHLTAHFGHAAVKNITRGDCQRCLEKLIAGKHGAGRTYGLLGAILSYAVQQSYISTNPARGVQKPADGKREFRLDVDGYRALGKALEAAEARAEPWQAVMAIRLLALTGCRKGEILKLRLSEIDVSGRCLRLGDTKTGESTRALGEAALRVLKAAADRPGRPKSEWLLPGRDPRKPFNGLGGAWARIVGNNYTPHSLRHAFASACDEIGLSELTVATLLGHTSARTGSTTRGYISKPDAVLLAAADKVTRHIWQTMTGGRLGAEIVELRPTADVA